MTNDSVPGPLPQVYLVEILPDDDVESQFEPAHLFTDQAVADAYAASIVAPAQARVTPMPVRTTAPAVVTIYSFTQGQNTDPRTVEHGWERNYDPATETLDVETVDETDPRYEDLTGTPPVTVQVQEYPDLHSTVVKVHGTDPDAVLAEYARTFTKIRSAALAAAKGDKA